MSENRLLSALANAPGVESRFWGRVDKRGPDDCWEWTGNRNPRGYGQLAIKGSTRRAHRVSFALIFGWEPAAVLHRCDNPPCVNPAHLVGGTQADNVADAVAKGRARCAGQPGSANSQAKLTEERVRQARIDHAAGQSIRSLANREGIARRTMRQIVRRERWTHV